MIRAVLAACLLSLHLAGAEADPSTELNAVYATQLTFETSSPIVYVTTGICIESAVKVGDRIQVNLPPFQDILAWEFVGLAKNMAYIVDFEEHTAAYDFSAEAFTINTRAVPESKLTSGLAYNVTVADVSVGVQYDIASAACYLKMGYA